MDDPESRSQVVLRRSQRLLAKSARTMSQSSRLAPRKPRKPSLCSHEPRKLSVYRAGYCPIYIEGRSLADFDKLRRTTRQANARYFRLAYQNVYDSISDGSLDIKETKHILVSNHNISNDYDKSHGIMWVAVHGINYICAVFKNKAPDMIRILDSLRKGVLMTYFGKYVLSEMEDHADSDITSGKPFAVVSVTRGTDNVVEENCYKSSGDKLDEEKAIEFLKREMDRESALTKEETIKTAIAAFHYLFKEKLKPEEIWVTAFRDDGSYDFTWDLRTHEIKKHLKDINNPSSQRDEMLK